MIKIVNLAEYIEKSNKKFAAATKAQKRVIIAKDVILRIQMDNLQADTGNFVRRTLLPMNDDSFKTYINNNETSCDVCAKGALFCSLIGRVNQLSTYDVYNIAGSNDINSEGHKELLKYFTARQLDAIEIAFEGRSYLNILSSEDSDKFENFYSEHFGSTNDRLIAICKNIIKNKGTFKNKFGRYKK